MCQNLYFANFLLFSPSDPFLWSSHWMTPFSKKICKISHWKTSSFELLSKHSCHLSWVPPKLYQPCIVLVPAAFFPDIPVPIQCQYAVGVDYVNACHLAWIHSDISPQLLCNALACQGSNQGSNESLNTEMIWGMIKDATYYLLRNYLLTNGL